MVLRLSADRAQERINQERRNANMRPGLRPTADQAQRNIEQAESSALQQYFQQNITDYFADGDARTQQPQYSEFNFSPGAGYRQALQDVAPASTQEYYDRIYRYNPASSVAPAAFASPRTLAARRRLQRRRALELLSTSTPETLDMFPTLRSIIADVPDLNEDDVRNLINLTQMESAFQRMQTADQISAQEIWMSMDPVMQAGFTDYFETRLGQVIEDMQKDPSWFQQGFEWLANNVIFPSFNALMYLNEGWQQATRSQAAAVQDSPANAALYLSPGVGFLVNSFRYWDSVAPGARDEDRLRLLRAQHGQVVDVFVDLEEKQRDGLGNAYARWIDDWADTEYSDVVRDVTYRPFENSDLIEIANQVSMTNRDNIGALTWGQLPEDWVGSQQAQTVSGLTNFGFTVFNDPTIIGSKVLMTARASRYALTKLAMPGGADEAFKYRRTRRIFNDLGRDLSRLKNIKDPKDRALARQKIDETYRGQLPADVIDDMEAFGVNNASKAYEYFKATENVTEILEGGPRFTQNELFARLMSAQAARRDPLLPGRNFVGTIASNARRNAAFLNPAIKGQVAKTAELLPDDPDELATVLMGEEYAAAVGMESRLGRSELLQGSQVFGYRYSARGVASRLDRVFRNFAKAPFNMTVDLMTGKDAGKIYEWSRAFLPRYHATAIADAYRRGTPGVRKRIIDGLQNSSARVRGVQYVSPDDDLLRFSAESRKGRRYSPAITTVRGPDGVVRSVDTSKGIDVRAVIEFNDSAETLYHGTVAQFDEFRAGAKNRWGRENSGVFYFTDDEQIAQRFGPERSVGTLEPSDLGDDVYDLYNLDEYVALDDAGKAAMDQDLRNFVSDLLGNRRSNFAIFDPETGSWTPASIDDLTVGRLYDYEFGRVINPNARVITADVFGKSVDLDPRFPMGLPTYSARYDKIAQEWYDGLDDATKQLLEDKFKIPVGFRGPQWHNKLERLRNWGDSYGHENDFAFHQWMRDNGYSKARVKDSSESGGRSIMVLPEAIAYGANDPLTRFQRALEQVARTGQSTDDAYRAFYRDEVVPGPVIGEATETRSMSSFENPLVPGEEIQLPIHLWQARTAVALPNFNEIYEAGVNASIFGATLGWTHHRVAQRIVDLWSLFNLAGPRYYLRNATEDYILYAMTSGKLASIQKGRRMSTALRESRGGKLRGFNRIRSNKRTVDLDMDVDTASRWSAIKASFSEEDIAKAQAALEAGDVEAVRKIAAIAIGRMKFSGMSGVETQYFLDYITLHGEKIIDEVAGATTYGSSASSPVLASAARGAVDAGGKSRIIYPGKEFADVPLEGNDPFRFWYWHRNILGAADNDGVIGKIAIANLDKSDDDIVPMIVKALQDDEVSKQYKYKELLASLNHPNETYETFARRYIADVRNLLSGKDGQLNRTLWNKLVTTDDNGQRVVRMNLSDAGETKFAIEVADLMQVPNAGRPNNVLGKARSGEVPTVRSVLDFDRWWEIMGDQYAVFAREPIFFANYIEARKMLAPLEKTWTEQFGEAYTARRLAQIATDRAYLNTLSYTDNPLNRTMLAWNSRNVARYYRATEDFARRMLRVGRNYPQGFWKVALVYDTLDETGFVWTDENSQKFFVFPGSDALIKVLNQAFEILPGNLRMLNPENADLELRGMVTMIAPSTDPKQSIPSLSSPLAALPVQALMNLFPSLQSFEQALLGEYAEGQAWWRTVVPGHVLRLMDSIDPDERQGIYASTIKDAIAIAAASGQMPDPQDSDAVKNEFLGGLQTLATTVLITRLIAGVTFNTTPRVAFNDVTQFARDRGFVDMDAGLKQLIDEKAKQDAINPVGEALTQYVQTFGLDAVPYSLSKYDTGSPWGTYSGRISPPSTDDARIWAIENNDLITNEKYKSGAVWLMPRTGDFNGDMWRYNINMGMKTPSTVMEFFEEAQGVSGRWLYYTVKEAHDKRINDAQIKRYEAVMAGDNARAQELSDLIDAYEYDWENNAVPKMKAQFRSLDFGTFEIPQNARYKTLNNEIIPMLNYVLNERDEEPPATAVNMMQAINTFNKYISEIDSIEGQTRVENERKYMLRSELKSILIDIGERDENTKLFVESILAPLVDRPERYVDLMQSEGIAGLTRRTITAGGDVR